MHGRLHLVLTFDVEFNKPSIIEATGSLYSGLTLMPEVVDIFKSRGVPATWLIAHDLDPENQVARLFPALVERMAAQGEIGCHFHFHERRRPRTDEPFQRLGIGEATRHLRSLGHAVTSFRGGNCYLDRTMLRVLEDLGYTVDSSVVPGLKETSPEGLVTDHTARRRSDPYYPMPGAPWESGGQGILEVPLATDTLVDLRTPLISLLINRVVGINNLVMADPGFAIARIEANRRRRGGDVVMVLSAHPYDFLPDPGRPQSRLENLDRFLSLAGKLPGVSFTTLAGVCALWPRAAMGSKGSMTAPAARSLLSLTSSDLRRARRSLKRAFGGRRPPRAPVR